MNHHYQLKAFSLFIFCLPYLCLFSQEDAYHLELRNFLEEEYDITGGSWILGDNEDATLASAWSPVEVQKTIINISDQAFTKAINLKTEDTPENYWEYSTHFGGTNQIAQGDKILLVFWIKGIEGERGNGFVQHVFGLGEAPYTNYYNVSKATPGDWQQWIVPIHITEDLNSYWYNIQLGFQVQELEIGGLAALNFGTQYDFEELPKTTHELSYEGRDLAAEWRGPAQERIETHRMDLLSVKVVDEMGNPIEGATVEILQKEHDFGFGTALGVFEKYNNPFWLDIPADQLEIYYDKFYNLNGEDRGFNWVVIEDELRQKTWEDPYWPPFDPIIGQGQTLNLFNELLDAGKKIRGHMLVWPDFMWSPEDYEEHANDPDYIRNRIEQHIMDMVGHEQLIGNIVDWNVINEPAHLKEFENLLGGKDDYVTWFNLARDIDPNAKFYLNEYGILSNEGMDKSIQKEYKDIIEFIDSNGSTVDGVGLEGHVKYPLASIEHLYEIIDEYAQLGNGKEISISEYDALDVEENTAADYMRDFLTICFSHPSVKSFLVWGFWDRNHWLGDAPFFRDDWSLKSSGQVYFDLVFDEWWTDEQGITNANGEFEVPAFIGKQQIIVSKDNIEVKEVVTLEKDSEVFEITLDQTVAVLDQKMEGHHLGQNFPNPAFDRTLIDLTLSRSEYIKLHVTDVLGQRIKTVEEGQLSEGSHRYFLNLTSFSPGVYYYHLETEKGKITKRMIIQ